MKTCFSCKHFNKENLYIFAGLTYGNCNKITDECGYLASVACIYEACDKYDERIENFERKQNPFKKHPHD